MACMRHEKLSGLDALVGEWSMEASAWEHDFAVSYTKLT
jgi:hypothetical protein